MDNSVSPKSKSGNCGRKIARFAAAALSGAITGFCFGVCGVVAFGLLFDLKGASGEFALILLSGLTAGIAGGVIQRTRLGAGVGAASAVVLVVFAWPLWDTLFPNATTFWPVALLSVAVGLLAGVTAARIARRIVRGIAAAQADGGRSAISWPKAAGLAIAWFIGGYLVLVPLLVIQGQIMLAHRWRFSGSIAENLQFEFCLLAILAGAILGRRYKSWKFVFLFYAYSVPGLLLFTFLMFVVAAPWTPM